ncbi:hypothetical protein ACKKBG_A20440 [Auxenochlorella protothecoides x Auxenochlorella symbiontica]
MSAVEAHVQQLTVTELPSSLASILARFPNLRPAKKAPNEPRTPSKGYGVQSTQRQALAQGLVLLMQRASDLDTPDLTQLCRSALHQTFQREPWMWSLLLQRHADLVLAHAGAARLLAGVLSSLPDAMQARALESLAGHLQAAATATAAATGASARDGLEPFLALALNVLEAGFPGGLKGGGRGEAEEAQDPTQDTTQPPDFRPSPASAPALRLILVAGTATTSLGRRRAIRALAAQLSCAATVARIVGAWGEGRAAQRARRIQALALLLAGDCASRAFQPVTEEAGAVQGARTSLAALSTLLAVHWELAQYLAALGSRSSDAVDWPPPLRAQILRLLLDPDGVGGRQGPRIGLAPPLLAHALGLVAQGPLATGGDHAAHAEALRLVWLGHCACIQGLTAPHLVLHPGVRHGGPALMTAYRLHDALAGAGRPTVVQKSQPTPKGTGKATKRQRQAQEAAAAPPPDLLALLLGGAGAGHQSQGESASQWGGARDARLAAGRVPEEAERPLPSNRASMEEGSLEASAVHPLLAMGDAALQPMQGNGQVATPAPLDLGTEELHAEEAGPPAASEPPRRRIQPQRLDAELPLLPIPAPGPPSPGRSGASGEQPDSDSGSLPPARVLMRPTPDMGEEEREAMWAAYIADKESMLDLLGDARYRDWFDEDSAPPPAARGGGGVDGALDAAFGGGTADGAPASLPASFLETSVAAPWQGAGAACLGLALCTLRACDGAGEVYAGDKVGAANGPLAWVQALLPPLEGSDAVALGVQAALGLLGFQSRNCWTAAMQGASSCPLGMVGLTLALHLHELVTRRARWAAPVWLEAVLKLLCWLMPLARQEAKQAALAERVARYAPLALLPDILREVLSSSRLGPSNLTPSSATALLDLEATPGRAPELADKAVTVWASLAWLAFHAAGHADCTEDPLPDWVVEEALDHPVVGVRGDTLRAALDWLFRRLAAAAAGWTGIAIFATPADPQTADDAAATPATTASALLPVWDVAATCACEVLLDAMGGAPCRDLGRRGKARADASPRRPPSPCDCEPAGRPIVPGAAPPALLVSGALDLMAACLACARRPLARLAAELDALTCAHAGRGSRDPRAATPPHAAHAAAEVLALSLELAGRVGGCVAVHEAAALEARRLLEEVMGLQAACAELLRTCPEACVAALASTADAAPRLFDPGEPGGADGADASPVSPESSDADAPPAQPAPGAGRNAAARRRARLARVTNPYLKAVLCEEGGECVGEGELSDLEDFIVANPERDYGSFIGAHFPRPHESESEEGSGEGAAPPQDHD